MIGKADGESAVLTKISEMPERDRVMRKRLRAVIKASAPALAQQEVKITLSRGPRLPLD